MHITRLAIVASLLLAACGVSGKAQLVGDDPMDLGGSLVVDVFVTDVGCTPSEISFEGDRKTILRFINQGGPHAIVSNDLSIGVALKNDEHSDILIPTGRDGTFDLQCGLPGQNLGKGTITIGD